MRGTRVMICCAVLGSLLTATGTRVPVAVGATQRHYGPAIIGAPYADWLHAYGPSMKNTSKDVPGWRPCANHVTAGLLVTFVGGRATQIVRQHCAQDTVLPISARRTLAMRFFPKDALAHGTGTTANGRVWRYRSKTLARIPALAGEFTDCDGNDVAPGTFVFSYEPGGDDGTWSVDLGSCGG